MSTRTIIECDSHVGICKAALSGFDQYDCHPLHAGMEEGWGKVEGHDEHYCPTCWPIYCKDNNVDVKTGRDF